MHSNQNSSVHSLPGPEDIFRQQLPNGMIVLSRANFNSPSVVVQGYLQAGGLFDLDDKLGLADFTASALMRGTQRRSFQQIYDTLESAGASLGVGGGVHTVTFSGKALAEDLDLLLGLAAEILRAPIFPEEQVERLRGQLLASLAIRAQDTGEMASLAFDQLVYRGHPYSRPEEGFPETIQTIKQADLLDFHRRYYGPLGMALVIVGAVEPAQAMEKANRVLGDWQNPAQPQPPELPPVQPLDGMVSRKVVISGKSQTDLVMGAAGPRRASPDYYAASLGNNILGQFGMMGRIGEVVREKAGLAYYAGSSLSGGIGPGPWQVSAGVDPQNVERAVDLIRQEIRRFVSQTVEAEELADSQANYIGRLPLSLESNAGMASALINLERYGLRLDHYQHYAELIRSVTVDQVLQAARTYLDPDCLAVAVAGP
ncbi:MAG: insulinase family protein [Anaerolineales bacterium]|nr:insulinase family protein [Anaerolineales bacterium]